MGKEIWIFNHYATNMFFEQGGRHYWFAKNLLRSGYNVKIFCANTVHNSDLIVDTKGKLYIKKTINDVPFVFVKTRAYKGNGKKRILNIFDFYFNLFKVCKYIAKKDGLPDILYASSVHPLTLVAGIEIAKQFKVSCICEMRDLWPETFVLSGKLSKYHPVTLILRKMEKWIYKKSDALIFTMEGGVDYIIERRWDTASGGNVDLKKAFYINNGLDLENYKKSVNKNILIDPQLEDNTVYKIVYTGSIRNANGVVRLVELASELKREEIDDINILVYGDGDLKSSLQEIAANKGLSNISFKGKVEKKYIPYILSKCSLNILNYDSSFSDIMKYGGSHNKLFEYIASGNPILSTYEEGKYGLINRGAIGLAKNIENSKQFLNAVIDFKNASSEELSRIKHNEEEIIKRFDFNYLTQKLIEAIEHAEKQKNEKKITKKN